MDIYYIIVNLVSSKCTIGESKMKTKILGTSLAELQAQLVVFFTISWTVSLFWYCSCYSQVQMQLLINSFVNAELFIGVALLTDCGRCDQLVIIPFLGWIGAHHRIDWWFIIPRFLKKLINQFLFLRDKKSYLDNVPDINSLFGFRLMKMSTGHFFLIKSIQIVIYFGNMIYSATNRLNHIERGNP